MENTEQIDILREIYDSWTREEKALLSEIDFCRKHEFQHEADFLYQRYSAIADILNDLRRAFNHKK